jgi:hypothetical protein
MDTENDNSRADALTDAQRRTLQSALDLFVSMGHAPGSDHVRTLAGMLATCPVEQHEAAPAAWDKLRHSLAVAMCGFVCRPDGRRNLDAAVNVLDALTEPGSPLAWLRTIAPTAENERPAFSKDVIREVFMAHGFTIKEGQTDLKQYVFDAAYALLARASSPNAARRCCGQSPCAHPGKGPCDMPALPRVSPPNATDEIFPDLFHAGLEEGNYWFKLVQGGEWELAEIRFDGVYFVGEDYMYNVEHPSLVGAKVRKIEPPKD